MNGSAILTYHSLDDSGSVISVSPALFGRQMEWLAEAGTAVVPLDEVRDRPGSVALTFDDGFQNFYEHALPVLTRHGFPATVFVVSGRCGDRNRWPQPVDGIPELPLMSWEEIEAVAEAGITIGAHTVTHPHLTNLAADDLARELCGCRAELEDRIGRPVDTFAYPYGYLNEHVRAAAAGCFHLACGTRLNFVEASSDPFELPRIDVFYLRSRRWFAALHDPGGRAYISVRRWVREWRESREMSAARIKEGQ